jgi:hypothetical protein
MAAGKSGTEWSGKGGTISTEYAQTSEGQCQAYAWSRTRMGGGAVAESPILRTTMAEKRFRKRGYRSMRECYHIVQF